MRNREIEVKFLEIDKPALIKKLKSIGATDLGEDFLKEMIFYDAAGKWAGEGKTFVRIRHSTPSSASAEASAGRQSPPSFQEGEKREGESPTRGGEKIRLTYKNLEAPTATGTEEIEFGISDAHKAKDFLEKLNLVLHREQEKRRHTFKLDEVSVDIDSWPKVPTYVEFEGPSEEAIKKAAADLGFDWKKAVFGNSRMVLEKYYNIPVGKLRRFTFEKIE